MANFNQDLERLEAFFLDIIDGRLSAEDEIRERGFSFFGEQGPWYTVGYQMAAMIERHDGRAKLIECMIDPRRLLARYNAAASELNLTAGDERLALWSPQLLHPIGAD